MRHYPDILAGALSAVNLCPIVLLSKLLVRDRTLVKSCSLGKMTHPKLLAASFLQVTRFAKRFWLLAFCVHRPRRHTP